MPKVLDASSRSNASGTFDLNNFVRDSIRNAPEDVLVDFALRRFW